MSSAAAAAAASEKPLFTRRTSTVTTVDSNCDEDNEQSGGSHYSSDDTCSNWRPPSVSSRYHSWDADNVARITRERSLGKKQQAKLQAFRSATRHVQHWKNGPYTAVQFLREWRWKVPAAVTAFERMIDWRHQHGIDGIADSSWTEQYYDPPCDYNYFPQAILQGTDRQGNPIYVERTGVTHLWELLNRHGNEETVRASTWIREKCTTGEWVAAWEAKAGRGLSGTTAIVDLQGLCRKHMAWNVMHAVKSGTQIIQANWPCEANRVIIIRAPALFRYVWSFLKPFCKCDERNSVFVLTIILKESHSNTLAFSVHPYSDGDGQGNDYHLHFGRSFGRIGRICRFGRFAALYQSQWPW